MSTCFLNGEFLPLAEARVPVLDRGFIFGDGVYEVIPALDGRLFAGAAHIERLERSLAAVAIANPETRDGWLALIRQVLAANGGGDQSVYLQVTRGVAERDHAFPAGVAPTVFVMSKPMARASACGRVGAWVLADNRWGRCDIKSTALLANVLLRNEAIARGAYEAILVRDGLVTEGAASNVFVVHGDVVRTPPLSNLLLPGVTRACLIDALRSAGFDVREEDFDEQTLRGADEIWLSSSTRDLLLVTSLDGKPLEAGGEAPLAARAFEVFQACKAAHLDPA